MCFCRCIRLPVSAPFHCSAMLPAAVGLRPLLSACTFATPVCPVLSNVTARPYESVTDIPDLLVDQVRRLLIAFRVTSIVCDGVYLQVVSPVDWLGCMTYAGDKDTEFVEIGQGRTLTNLAGRIHPKSRWITLADTRFIRVVLVVCQDWLCRAVHAEDLLKLA